MMMMMMMMIVLCSNCSGVGVERRGKGAPAVD